MRLAPERPVMPFPFESVNQASDGCQALFSPLGMQQ